MREYNLSQLQDEATENLANAEKYARKGWATLYDKPEAIKHYSKANYHVACAIVAQNKVLILQNKKVIGLLEKIANKED